jgi:hypothetical protein
VSGYVHAMTGVGKDDASSLFDVLLLCDRDTFDRFPRTSAILTSANTTEVFSLRLTSYARGSGAEVQRKAEVLSVHNIVEVFRRLPGTIPALFKECAGMISSVGFDGGTESGREEGHGFWREMYLIGLFVLDEQSRGRQ